jgi:hypothetical protein
VGGELPIALIPDILYLVTIELTVLLAATAAALAGAPLVVARARRRGRPFRRVLVTGGMFFADWWLWQIAFASAFGPQRWLIGPLTAFNAVVAFGAIYSLTGFSLHSDARIAGRTGLIDKDGRY